MSVSEIIRTKRDIREFSSQPVSKEDKLAILEAARMAGSGLNSQHWRFILIDDKSELEALARLSTTGEWVAGANFAVIILTEKNRPYHVYGVFLRYAVSLPHFSLLEAGIYAGSYSPAPGLELHVC
jgi:nitroreductase